MFQQIKYYLYKTGLIRKEKLILLTCLLFSGLFLTVKAADAIAFDWPDMALNALDFVDNTVLHWLLYLFWLAAGSGTLLLISSRLLDWSSTLPVHLDNVLVNFGWHYVAGLVNMFFILILIVIAFSYILKIESFGMKKALPRLLILAILVNFSLLFVKIFSDAGWIVQYSFKNTFFSGGGLAVAVTQPLMEAVNSLKLLLGGIVTSYTVAAIIPYGNVFALLGLVTYFLTGGVGAFSQVITVVIFNSVIGIIFLIFTGLFLARIVALWLLAIVSPLAFIAFILPKTEKYFHDWLKQLIDWSFLGAIMFFLLGLGLKLFALVGPGGTQETVLPPQLGGWKFIGTFYQYLFLIVYLIIAFGAVKKSSSVLRGVWDIGEKFFAGGVGGAGKLAGGLAKRAPQAAWVGRAEMATRKWGERLPFVGRAIGGPGALGTSLSKERAKIADEFKGRSPVDIRAAISRTPLTPHDRMRRAAGLQMLAEMDSLENNDRALLGDAQRYGANISFITGKMPTWTELTPADRTAGTTLPQAIANRVGRIANNQARNIRPDALRYRLTPTTTNPNAADVIRGLNPAQLQDITRAGNNQQRQNILNTIRELDPTVVTATGRLRHLLGSGPRPSGIDRSVIRYISEQQAAGTWPA